MPCDLAEILSPSLSKGRGFAGPWTRGLVMLIRAASIKGAS